MTPMDPGGESPPRWTHSLAVLVGHWRTIVQVTVIGTVVCFAISLMRAPAYQATAHLAVSPERAHMIVSPDPKTGILSAGVSEQDLNSEVELLKSDDLLRDVLRARKDAEPAAESGSFTEVLALPNQLYRAIHDVQTDALEYELQSVREDLDIQAVKGSNLIRISYKAAKPERAAALVNALAQGHVSRPASGSSEAGRFFESQRELLYASRRDAERTLRAFFESEDVSLPAESAETLRAEFLKLQADAVKARTGLAEAEARQSFLQAELKDHPRTLSGSQASTGAQDSPVQLIRTRVVELELQRSRLLGQFSPTSSKVAEIERQLEQARSIERREMGTAPGILSPARASLDLALAKAAADAAARRARVESLQAQIDRDKPYLGRLEAIAPERERLEQEVAAARESLKTYRRKQEEARFSSALDRSRIVNVSIVEPATVPSAPLPSANAAAILLGSLLSLLAGVGLAFLRDGMDPSVKSAAEAAEVGGIPILADLTT